VRVSAEAPPSGVVTFLFTDIEGSTRRWEADAGAMRAALLTHDKVLRTAIEARGGWLFKHTGDGVCAAFASPRSAEVKDRDGIDLQLRVGLNSGQVIAGEFGSTSLGYTTIGEQVGMAQRMESVASPGDVMLSASNTAVISFFIAAPPQLRNHTGSQRRCPPSAEPPGSGTVCRRPLRRR
jgi:class 3 adenylate cyclase